MPAAITRLISEPLVQFFAIGLVLYGVSVFTAGEVEDPRLIRVDAEVHRDLARIFEADRGRLPTVEEMDVLVDRWEMNEALFREARELRLDHGDEMMRERLVSRMRVMLYSGVTVEAPDDETLRAWFEERIDQYTQPARISFRVIGLDTTEAEARATASEINARETAGDPLRPGEYPTANMTNRPRPQMVTLFNENFVAAIEASPTDRWTPVETPRGWQLVRFGGLTPAWEPSFDENIQKIRSDWRSDRTHIEARAALEALQNRYPVERMPYDPAQFAPETAAASQ
ncbi:MAG: peptidylprolyl isomerase [Pseudomonadota bacterium]